MSKNKEKKANVKGLRSLLYNNKFVLLLSVILAFGIWIWVSIEKSPEVEVTISSVPVKIDMDNSVPAQLNLQIFGDNNYTVDITVKGKKFIVSALTADDFSVVAQTNYVDSAGKKSLQLKATSAKSNNFDIVGLSKNYIEVYFDTYKETEMALKPSIIAPGNKTVTDGCILGNIVFSKNTVIVSGPSTEVNKVTSVTAETSTSAPLTATTTVTPELKLVGAAADELSNVSILEGDTAITMTMPVLKLVELPTTVTFRNAPANYLDGNMNFSVSPSRISAAVPVEKVDQITSLSVGSIDFSELDAGLNTLNFKASDITEFMITDQSIKNFKVSVNMSGMTSGMFSVPAANVTITGQKQGYNSVVTSNGISGVKLIGPADSISKINPDMLSVKLDLTSYDVKEGEQKIPVLITVTGDTAVWAHGTYYVTINSTASEQ